MRTGRLTRRGRALAISALAAGLVTLALASFATGRSPELKGVGAASGVATGTFTLPPGVAARFYEIADAPDTNVFGYFRQAHLERFGVLSSNATSFTDDGPALPAGRYYVHVAGEDLDNQKCPAREFSNIMVMDVTASGSATGTNYGAGSPPCSAESGGGGGGGSGDRGAPSTSVRYKRTQDVDKLFVRARIDEAGTVSASGLVATSGLLAATYTFKRVTRSTRGGVLVRLRLKLAKKNLRAIKRTLRRGKRLRARIAVTGTDRAGNQKSRSLIIKLKR